LGSKTHDTLKKIHKETAEGKGEKWSIEEPTEKKANKGIQK